MPLHHGYVTGEPLPCEEFLVRMELGVRQVNAQCVELESYANQVKVGAAFAIGLSMVIAVATSFLMWSALSVPTTAEEWAMLIFIPWLGVLMVWLIHLGYQAVLGKNRGAFVRIHRDTRKVYFVSPGQTHLHALDWDRLEVLAGYVPIVSQSGYTSRHPLYLIGVDDTLHEDAVVDACGMFRER